jgi:hypothetical protein
MEYNLNTLEKVKNAVTRSRLNQGIKDKVKKNFEALKARKQKALLYEKVLLNISEDTDQEIRGLAELLNDKYAVQPAFVLENPVDMEIADQQGWAGTGVYGSMTKNSLARLLSGSELVLEKPEGNQVLNLKIPVDRQGDPPQPLSEIETAVKYKCDKVKCNRWADAVKEDYDFAKDKIENIPKFYILTAKRNGHLALYVEYQNVLYSFGFGHVGIDFLEDAKNIELADFAGQAVLAKQQIQETLKKETKVLEGIAVAEAQLDEEKKASEKVSISDRILVGLIKGLMGEEYKRRFTMEKLLSGKENAINMQEKVFKKALEGVFYSPDTLVKPKYKTKEQKYWKHRLVDFGFLKKIHLDRINEFLEKAYKSHIMVYFQYLPKQDEIDADVADNNGSWRFQGIYIPSMLEYRFLSNEDIVIRDKNYVNCTSLLVSIFRERIRCLTKMIQIAPGSDLLAAQSLGIISNPGVCKHKIPSAYPTVKDMFKAYMEYRLGIQQSLYNSVGFYLTARNAASKGYTYDFQLPTEIPSPEKQLFDSMNGKWFEGRKKELEESSYTGFGLRAKAAETLPTWLSRGIGLYGGKKTRKHRKGKKHRKTRRA